MTALLKRCVNSTTIGFALVYGMIPIILGGYYAGAWLLNAAELALTWVHQQNEWAFFGVVYVTCLAIFFGGLFVLLWFGGLLLESFTANP